MIRAVLDWCRRATTRQDDLGLRERLREAAPVDGAAAERAWEVACGAYAAREPLPGRRRHRRRVRALAVASLALLLGALVLSPAGAKVGGWIDRAIDPAPSRPAAALPAPGRLLVSGLNGSWVVEHDLTARHLGEHPEAAWSAKGNYVLLTNRVGLSARDDRGATRWTLERPRIGNLAWSRGDGYRVAYRSGRTLRVVAGDGSGDRLLDRASAPVTPSWRPGPTAEHVLAYARPGGRVELRDVDRPVAGGRTLIGSGPPVRALAWVSPDRLLVLRGGGLSLLDAAGRVLSRLPGPSAGRFHALTASPVSRTAAFVRSSPRGATSVVWSVRFPADGPTRPAAGPTRPGLLGGRARMVFAGAGTIRSLAFSPDGRWLAFAWPPSDQWIFERVGGRPRLATVGHVTRRLGHIGDPADSAVVGWAR
ncbi:WD40 repeat domain-containing protein [Conexibacter woesei]|uniref:WD40 repeat domain-containing protein n=1 Tax=Conexibacter woesei (strain DSM 14684 / CCUG 47730 / CIP 108061 / JCM 11494 / NBRC 100937 / ID131577) TaxID=469383 RepID=D3FAC7_CONWI|nr:hypothetical protein [Conexibacter woesei]ADB49196.1 hypothetical protein Cwoe_0763 [Conexibacter woesei DSM 14684]